MISKIERKFHKYYYSIHIIYDLGILLDPCLKYEGLKNYLWA